MDGFDLARAMKQTKFRYGIVERTKLGVDILGTAVLQETEDLKTHRGEEFL